MNEIILLVEDLAEEQQKAKAALARFGFRVAVTSTLIDALRIWEGLGDKLVGILTDLHFPESSIEDLKSGDPIKPCGLAIVAQATKQGKSVVVCSDLDHHRAEYVKLVIAAFEEYHNAGKIPFVMDQKDWDRAAKELAAIIEKNEKGGKA